MDKCRRKDMIRNKEIKDWGDPCWWKDEGESLEMDRSCLEESNYCTNEKEWVVQVEGIKKGRGRPRIILIVVVKNGMSMHEVLKSMTSNRIEHNGEIEKGGVWIAFPSLRLHLHCFSESRASFT